jgi:hypothetical protein
MVVPANPRRWPGRKAAIKYVLSASVFVAMLLAGELLVRAIDGYRLFSPRLQPVSGRDAAAGVASEDLVVAFLAQPALASADLDAAWFRSSPPPVPPQGLSASLAAAFAAGVHPIFLLQWNEVLVRAAWSDGLVASLMPGVQRPDTYFLFTPPDGQPSPRYRYPLATTLPSSITTNAFGFRGRQLTCDKPPRTVRIACVGASTTVDDHALPFSYPEFLEHFLVQWAARHRPDLRFEVINAGCDGYRSDEIAATVRHYVLPLEVDYVVYYEGANQMQLAQVERHVRRDGPKPPLPMLPGLFDPTAAAQGDNRWLYEHSAGMRRLHTVLAGKTLLAEPPKPAQSLVLPQGLDEQSIDLSRAGEVLDLGPVLADLATIRADVVAAGGRLVLCSYRWFVHDSLLLDPVLGEHVYRYLNRQYWPVSYAILRRLADLQNRWYAEWARANDVAFLDIAAALPQDGRLYTDAVHKTGLGSRCHGWAAFALLLPLIERDLADGRIPTPDRRADAEHPNVHPMRSFTTAELDAGR